MSFWMTFSWILVGILTTVNIFAFIKLKQVSQQMLKMAFPGAKNFKDGMAHMESQMKEMTQMMSGARGGNPFGNQNVMEILGQLSKRR
ncbi:MAG: hypothetical protein HY843_08565 [Bdellovibrio sp.]|nr:hypothetical protein [Bdellovibrio sp.]